MVEAVESAKVANMVWYNYRRVPAVTLAKQLIDEGRLGKIFHYRAKFLQDWTISKDLPQGGQGLWRLDVGVAGSGVTGDLLAHCIDTAMWLNGGIASVTGMTETFIKERHHNITGKTEKVGIDDASLFLSRFDNGSLGSFEATRYARGHKALYTLEINGEHASIFWDLHDLHRLQYFDHRDEGRTRGWRSVHITDGDHPYMNKWWVPGLQIGYEHTFIHQAADFIEGIETGKPAAPTFRDALATDLVTDAVLKSAQDRAVGECQGLTPNCFNFMQDLTPQVSLRGVLQIVRDRLVCPLQQEPEGPDCTGNGNGQKRQACAAPDGDFEVLRQGARARQPLLRRGGGALLRAVRAELRGQDDDPAHHRGPRRHRCRPP